MYVTTKHILEKKLPACNTLHLKNSERIIDILV